jgi:hypothetical protein
MYNNISHARWHWICCRKKEVHLKDGLFHIISIQGELKSNVLLLLLLFSYTPGTKNTTIMKCSFQGELMQVDFPITMFSEERYSVRVSVNEYGIAYLVQHDYHPSPHNLRCKVKQNQIWMIRISTSFYNIRSTYLSTIHLILKIDTKRKSYSFHLMSIISMDTWRFGRRASRGPLGLLALPPCCGR